MADITTKHVYKIYRNSQFKGVLQNVQSDFGYVQAINTAATQIDVTVGLNPDTSHDPVEPILTESGEELLTETNEIIVTERAPDAVGNANNNALIQNNNDIEIYEYSNYHPNGKLVFSGFISRHKQSFANSNVTFTAISYGGGVGGLDHYLVMSGDTLDVDYGISDPDDFYFGLGNSKFEDRNYAIQSWEVGVGITSLSSISLRAAAAFGHNGTQVRVEVFNNLMEAQSRPGSPLTTATQSIIDATVRTYTFSFTTPLDVTAGQTYYMRISTDWDAVSINYTAQVGIMMENTGLYADGQLYEWNLTSWVSYPGSDIRFATYSSEGSTTAPYLNTDPSDMLRDIIDVYNNQGGEVTYTDTSIEDTGLSLDYTFKVNTILEAVKKIQAMTPADWYWYVDPATNVIHLKETNTTPDHKLILGRHIHDLVTESSIEDIRNIGYFTGGDTGSGENLYLFRTEATSLANNRRGLERLHDTRVTVLETGEAILESFLAENSDEDELATCFVLEKTYDITSLDIGDTVGFAGFGTSVDNLVLQIVNKSPRKGGVQLDLGELPMRASTELDQIRRKLDEQATVDNPDAPS